MFSAATGWGGRAIVNISDILLLIICALLLGYLLYALLKAEDF